MLVRINLEGGIVFQIGPKMSQFLVENCNSFIDIFWDFQTMWKGLRAELQAPPVVYNILNDQKGMT